MAEIIGVAASAVTLAALFKAETLLVKLDCEKARLLVWANTVGILCTDYQGRYPQLLVQETLIRRCIDQIIGLLTDAQKLQAEYGGRPTAQQEIQRYVAVVSVNSMNIFKTTKRRFFARAGGLNETPNWLSRIKWAIRDGAKFRILLSHLKEFVDNIIELVPVPLDVINSTVEEDITTNIDIRTLRLTESACEGSYPSWSARASEVIKDSEIGTLDRRNFEEMIRDTDEPEIAKKESRSDRQQNFTVIHGISHNFVVLTDKCLDLEADGHCESATIGGAVTGGKDLSFTCAAGARWNLGRRILINFKPFDSQEEMSKVESRRLEIAEHTGDLPDVRPVSRIYIHCGPCACAIQTALNLTVGDGVSEYLDFAIRIDERLPTSCRRSSPVVDVLTALHDTIDEQQVAALYGSKRLGFIDTPELERRIYNLEQEQFGYFEPTSVLQKILVEDYKSFQSDLPIGAVIFIAETDLCQISLESRPFISEARKPRETDIFAFTGRWIESEYLWQRIYTGSYSRSKKAIEKMRALSSLLTDLIPPPSSNVIATTPSIPRNKRPRSESANSDG